MDDLINQLILEGYLKTPNIIKAFKTIKRQDFVLPEDLERANRNYPLPIGYSQAIPQPSIVAFMLELLQAQSGDKILEIGSGSGWQTALLCKLVGDKGEVHALERIPKLTEMGENNIAKYNFIENGVARVLCQDGSLGLPGVAPFDKIIAAAAPRTIPIKIKEQLKIGGRLVMPVGPVWKQNMVVLEKVEEDTYKEHRFPGFIFVPLISN